MATLSKQTKSYRQDPAIVALIERAADLAGVSEAFVLDECVLAQIEKITRQRVRRQSFIRDPQALADFAQAVRSIAAARRKPGGSL